MCAHNPKRVEFLFESTAAAKIYNKIADYYI